MIEPKQIFVPKFKKSLPTKTKFVENPKKPVHVPYCKEVNKTSTFNVVSKKQFDNKAKMKNAEKSSKVWKPKLKPQPVKGVQYTLSDSKPKVILKQKNESNLVEIDK